MDPLLTSKQDKVLKIIRDFYLDNGYAPSLTELQKLLNISTKRGVVNHLIALERKGYIMRTSEPRGIHLVEDEEPIYEYLIGIPVLGYANAGTPLVSAEEENLGVINVQKKLIKGKKDLFSLIIKGDSMDRKVMDGKLLTNGSYLIVQKDTEIDDGDIVVAIIDNSATVKNFKRSKDMVILYPESSNPKHKPIYLDKNSESMINGKVIKVLENPEEINLE
jgi:repressor LexA